MPRDAQELIGDIQVCTEIPPVHVPRIKRRMVAISNPDKANWQCRYVNFSVVPLSTTDRVVEFLRGDMSYRYCDARSVRISYPLELNIGKLNMMILSDSIEKHFGY